MKTNRFQPPPPPREPAREPTISLESLLLQDLNAWTAAKEAIARASSRPPQRGAGAARNQRPSGST